jgi:hypothetical protein
LTAGIVGKRAGKMGREGLRAMRLAVGCDLVYGLVPWERSLEDRALELVEREVWRKRYTAIKRG